MALQVDPEVQRLRVELEIAQEKIRQLERAISNSKRWVRLTGLHLTRPEQAIVLALLTTQNEVRAERLRHAMDISLGRTELGSLQSVNVALSHLRTKLRALVPPVQITTVYGVGLWLDPGNRARLEARWENRPVSVTVPA